MTVSDTNVQNLIINILTKQQYEGIANPSPTELYFVTDEGESISTLGDVSLNNLSNDQILKYNSTSGKWENSSVPPNLVTSISSASTDSQCPSAKCMYDIIGNIETLLSQI